MTTLLVHSNQTTGQGFSPPTDEDLTGMLIDHATVLGWDQGFTPKQHHTFAWQINEAGWDISLPSHSSGSDPLPACWVQCTLPQDRNIPAPFAGIASSTVQVLSRIGWDPADGYTFVFGVDETCLSEPEGMVIFENAPLAPTTKLDVSLKVPVGYLDNRSQCLMAEALVGVGPALKNISPHATPHGPFEIDVPEYHEISWTEAATVRGTSLEWSAEIVGALANQILWKIQQSGFGAPVLLHFSKL